MGGTGTGGTGPGTGPGCVPGAAGMVRTGTCPFAPFCLSLSSIVGRTSCLRTNGVALSGCASSAYANTSSSSEPMSSLRSMRAAATACTAYSFSRMSRFVSSNSSLSILSASTRTGSGKPPRAFPGATSKVEPIPRRSTYVSAHLRDRLLQPKEAHVSRVEPILIGELVAAVFVRNDEGLVDDRLDMDGRPPHGVLGHHGDVTSLVVRLLVEVVLDDVLPAFTVRRIHDER